MSPPTAPCRVRPAAPEDAPLLLAFIRKLADYEGLLDAVHADEAAIRCALSGHRPRLESHVAEVDGAAVGCSVFFETYSTFAGRPKLFLEDIIVDTDWRGRGIGRRLFEAFLDEARRRGCVRAEWQVLDWNASARSFYERQGAAPVTGWIPYSHPLTAELSCAEATP